MTFNRGLDKLKSPLDTYTHKEWVEVSYKWNKEHPERVKETRKRYLEKKNLAKGK